MSEDILDQIDRTLNDPITADAVRIVPYPVAPENGDTTVRDMLGWSSGADLSAYVDEAFDEPFLVTSDPVWWEGASVTVSFEINTPGVLRAFSLMSGIRGKRLRRLVKHARLQDHRLAKIRRLALLLERLRPCYMRTTYHHRSRARARRNRRAR